MAKRWIEIIINVVFWGVTGWLIASGFSIQSQEVEMIDNVETVQVMRSSTLIMKLLMCIAISMLMFYTNLRIIGRLKTGFKPNIILFSLLVAGAAFLVYYFIEYLNLTNVSLPLPTTLSHGIFIFYYTISVAYGMGRTWVFLENQRSNLLIEKKQAELNLLRNQLQPHFLFNVLNNLLSMVDQMKNPVLADSLDRLSGLLRFVVYDTSQPTVTIQREIEFLQNYADLQLLRFEKEEVNFELEIQGSFDQQKIEPGIFISFVENAFKYGVEPEQCSAISVLFILIDPGEISFKISNPVIRALKNESGSGSGIQSTRDRLEMVYPEAHKLQITENDNFTVELKIQTDAGHHRR